MKLTRNQQQRSDKIQEYALCLLVASANNPNTVMGLNNAKFAVTMAAILIDEADLTAWEADEDED